MVRSLAGKLFSLFPRFQLFAPIDSQQTLSELCALSEAGGKIISPDPRGWTQTISG